MAKTEEGDDVGPSSCARAEHSVDQVDADVAALQQRVPAAQQIGDRGEVDRGLVGPDGGLAEQTARDHLVEDGARHDDDGRAEDAAEPRC